MDPLSAIGNLVVGLIRTHHLNEWARLCFAMTWSYGTAFSFGAGAALVAHNSPAAAIGAGLVAAASAVCFLFARSPLTRNLMVAVPRELVVVAEGQGIVTMEPQR